MATQLYYPGQLRSAFSEMQRLKTTLKTWQMRQHLAALKLLKGLVLLLSRRKQMSASPFKIQGLLTLNNVPLSGIGTNKWQVTPT